jgi:Ca2+-binding EF-hand superfamily protein
MSQSNFFSSSTADFGFNLCKYFSHLIENEKNIELHRQILGRFPEFEPYAAFMRIDRACKKYITFQDLKQFLKENLVRFSDKGLQEMIRQYDKDSDGVLNYEEYMPICVTSNNPDLRANVTQRPNYKVDPELCLNKEIEQELSIIFRLEIEMVEYSLIKSEGIKYLYGFDVRNCFEEIDYIKDGYIDDNELSIFIKRFGFISNLSEIKGLLFRIGKKWKGGAYVITFEDFENIFYPDGGRGISAPGNLKYPKNSHQTKNSTDISSYYVKDTLDFNSSKKEFYNSPQENNISQNFERSDQFSPIPSKYSESYTNFGCNSNSFSKSPIIQIDLKNTSGRNINTNNNTNLNTSYTYTNFKTNKTKLQNLSNTFSNFPRLTKSKTSFDYQKILSNFFGEIITLESKAECLKEKLALESNVSLNILFQIFDKYFKGAISVFDFKDGLNSLDIFATGDEIKLLFKRYVNTNNGLDYIKFGNMILPKNSEYAKLFNSKENEYVVNERTRINLIDLIRVLIDNENRMENLRKYSTDHPLFKVSDAFHMIKVKLRNYITGQDVCKKLF